MTSHNLFETFRSYTHKEDGIFPVRSDLIEETPLEIIINQERRILIMFTPQMIKELVVGFVFTEGLIQTVWEIKECVISSVPGSDGEQVIEARVTIPSDKVFPASKSTRVSYSSCGICGKENFNDLQRGLNRVKSRRRFSMDFLTELAFRMEKFQPLYNRTGGAHAAVVFDSNGKAVFHSEDMGRHNALDKVIGCTVINEVPCDDKIVVSSGRASLEMIVKAVRAGFPIFVAMSRPTSRAVQAAKFYNITLIDMAKDSNRIYSHVRRIEGY